MGVSDIKSLLQEDLILVSKHTETSKDQALREKIVGGIIPSYPEVYLLNAYYRTLESLKGTMTSLLECLDRGI